MNDPLTAIEEQLTGEMPARAPSPLRDAVMKEVHRELKSARWDRRLTKVAGTVLAVGIALNVALMVGGDDFSAPRSTASNASLVQTAVAVARATDAQTARQLVSQISAWNGHVMTTEQLAALDAAIAEELQKNRKG
ncbi:hypothetical protein [Aeoliella sp. SH292]|uniref:hypothetical protein n=1 Tax=Aeoliella sp. SH292 TaxID=3454464 RepID=UPI003F98B258